jgi:hypothetical protein
MDFHPQQRSSNEPIQRLSVRAGSRYAMLRVEIPVMMIPADRFFDSSMALLPPPHQVARHTPWEEDQQPIMLAAGTLQTREAVEGEFPCYVCHTNFPNARFTPCGHAEICCACAHQVVQRGQNCPLCRAVILSFERV